MKLRLNRECLICSAIALAGILAGSVVGINSERSATTEIDQPSDTRPRLSALNTSPQRTKARNLISDTSPDSGELWQALDGCDNADLEKLLNHALAQASGYYSAQLIIAKWIEIDPAAATLAASRTNFSNPMLFYAAVDRWAEFDPSAALTLINEMPSNDRKCGAYYAVVRAIEDTNPAELPGYLDQLPPEFRKIKLENELSKLAETDLAAALNSCVEISAPSYSGENANTWRQQVAGGLIFLGSDQLQPAEIINIYDNDTRRRLGDVPGVLVDRFYEDDPEAAIAWLTDPEKPLRSAKNGLALAELVGRRDNAAAANILSALPAGSERTSAIADLVYEWARADAAEARAWAFNFEDEKLRIKINKIITESEQ